MIDTTLILGKDRVHGSQFRYQVMHIIVGESSGSDLAPAIVLGVNKVIGGAGGRDSYSDLR